MIRIEKLALRQGAFSLPGIDLEVPSGAYGALDAVHHHEPQEEVGARHEAMA